MEHVSFWTGLWIIMLAIIGFMSIIANIECNNKREWIIGKILLFVFIIMLAIFTYGHYKMFKSSPIWNKTANESLVSLNDNNMMSGKIYARRGYINENLYYQYMVDVGCGGYVANKVPSNGTTIYIDNKNPRCEWYEVSQQWWIFKQWSTKWKLYVPDGTIGDSYTIDLQ